MDMVEQKTIFWREKNPNDRDINHLDTEYYIIFITS